MQAIQFTPQKAQTNLSKRIVFEVCETTDSPGDFGEFMQVHEKIVVLMENLKIACLPKDQMIHLMLQLFPFTWEIISTLSNLVDIDLSTPIVPFEECKLPITTGYAELNEYIPPHLTVCKYTQTCVKDGVIVLQNGTPPFCMSIEALVLKFENTPPEDLNAAWILPATHPDAVAAIHSEAVKVLVSATQQVRPLPALDLTGRIVEVIVEADACEKIEFFLVTEYNRGTGELCGFWIYTPAEMPGDWDTAEEGYSIATDAEDTRIFFSDHFDVVHEDTLSPRCRGPVPIKLNHILPNIAGAWSSKHTTAFVGQERVRTFVDMLKTVDEVGYGNANLKLWRSLHDRVCAILPSGIDSSIQRAQDLQERIWEGASPLSLAEPLVGRCDCCGLQRTLTVEFGDGWYVGKTCASKIMSIVPEIETAREM